MPYLSAGPEAPPRPGFFARAWGALMQFRAMPPWWSESSVGWNLLRGEAPSAFQQTGREARIGGWERNAVVQACVRVIAEILSAVPFEAYRKTPAGEEESIPDAEAPIIEELLEASDFGMSGARRRGLLAVHYLLYGNGALVIERRGGKPGLPNRISRLRLVHPEDISYAFLAPEADAALEYQWRDRAGTTHYSKVEDFIHFRDLAGGDWVFGYPRAAAALLEMSADQEGSEHVRQMLKNYGAPGVAVLVEGTPTGAELQTAKEKWIEEYSNRGGRGRPTFLKSVKDIKVIGFNLRELEFPEMRAIAREGICAVFGVDPRMVGIGSAKGAEGGLSGQQYAEARRRLIQQAVLPLMGALEAELNNWLSPEFGDVFVRFNRRALAKLTQDEKELSERARGEAQAGIITREEGRQMIGRSPEMEPTDTLIGTLGRKEYLVSDALEQGKPRDPFAALGLGGGPPGGSAQRQLPPGRGEEPEELPEERTFGRFLARGMALSRERRALLWQEFDTRAARAEAPYRTAAMALFQAERAEVAAAFTDASRASPDEPFLATALRRALEGYAKPQGKYYREWQERFGRLVSETVNVAGSQLAASAGLSFELNNPAVQAAIKGRAERLAGIVSRTSAEQIAAVVSAGSEAGLGIREIAGLIDESVFGGQAAARAQMIARTETVGALNEGEMVAAQALEIFEEKEWLTQGDDVVRDSHAALDGQRRPLAQEYAPNLAYPGDPRADPAEIINCRCTQLFYSAGARAKRIKALPEPLARVKLVEVMSRDAQGRAQTFKVTPTPSLHTNGAP